MATPADQLDTDADTPQQPQSALAALASPSLQDQARTYADNYFKQRLSGEDTRGEAAIFQQQDVDAEQARAALRQAREKLSAQRLDPSVLGLRFAQAMLSPSRYGIQDQWSKAAGTVADWRQQNQEFQQKQDAQDLSLQEQLANVDQQSQKSKLALEELRERTGAQTADIALKLSAKQGQQGPESPIGKLVTDRLGPNALQTPEGKSLFDKLVAQSHEGKTPAGGPPDPTAIDFGAYKLYKTGQMPQLGMGAGPARSAILAGAAHLAQREAGGEDISNPGYDQAIANGQDFTAAGRALGSFAGGPLGTQTRSLNNAVGHLKLFEDTFNALHNNDVQVLNKLGNAWDTAIGKPIPTTLKAMGQIIGPELTKILANTGAGSKEEREQFPETAGSLANSPEQTGSAIQGLRGMLGRQAADLALQYHGATGRSDFAKRYLAPDVAESLQLNPEGAQAAPKTAGQLPDAAKARLQEGFTTTFANGQKWTLHNGQPIQVQ